MGLKFLLAKPFCLLGLAMGLKFWLAKPFWLLGLAMGLKFFLPKPFLVTGPGYGIFQDSRVLRFSRARVGVYGGWGVGGVIEHASSWGRMGTLGSNWT